MGSVWLLKQAFDAGHDPIYRHRIAVKTFDASAHSEQVEQELNIWISLQHSSILPLEKIGRLDYRLAAIMPWMQGSLDDTLEQRGSLSESEVALLLLRVAEALDHAWTALRILHLDLKPSNVLTDGANAKGVRVADWGISRMAAGRRIARGFAAGRSSENTYDLRTAYSAGTPLFMAPERFSGEWTLSPSADVYSLGMMAVQLSTGVLPFRFGQVDPGSEIFSGSYYDNAHAMLAERTTAFRELCLSCIVADPRRRPDGYQEVLRALRSLSQRGGQ